MSGAVFQAFFLALSLARGESARYPELFGSVGLTARITGRSLRIVRRIAVLPTLLTLGNGLCGFAAIAYASKITLDLSAEQVSYYLTLSAGLILLAMVFDALDGTAARLSRSASEFGGQLDSLCDVISFGAAPAFLLLRLGQEWQGRPVIAKTIAVIAALYLACTILRLARFNVETTPDAASHKRFKGLPSPAAGGCLATLALLRAELGPVWANLDADLVRGAVTVWAPLGALLLAFLMVSRLPYPHFTRQLLRGRRNFRFLVEMVALAAVIALAPGVALCLAFWLYALNGPVRALFRHPRRGALPTHNSGIIRH
jgi:CDP-diacylglycerol--serine O-phosphatidyltransferase